MTERKGALQKILEKNGVLDWMDIRGSFCEGCEKECGINIPRCRAFLIVEGMVAVAVTSYEETLPFIIRLLKEANEIVPR